MHVMGRGERPARAVLACFSSVALWCVALILAPPAWSLDRVYEKVSPADKNGYEAFATGQRASTPSGDQVAFAIPGPGPGAASGVERNHFFATRGASNWSAQSLVPPVPAPPSQFVTLVPWPHGFSPDFSDSYVHAISALTPDATDGARNLYRRHADGTYELLTPGTPDGLSPIGPQFAGTSADGRHIIYEDDVPLTPTAPSGIVNAYEWAAGEVHLVGILPDGTPAADGSQLGSGVSFGSIEHAISVDGSRIFFRALESGDSSVGQLYVREIATSTMHVSASQRSAPDPAGTFPALFWTAESAHGSRVLFTSCEKLTDDATAYDDSPLGSDTYSPTCMSGLGGAVLPRGQDLYAYDVDTGLLSDLTTADAAGADVFGVVDASDDLARIYFVAGGVLADGATAGQPNLYLWDQGQTRFIATLDDTPAPADARVVLDSSAWTVSSSAKGEVVRATPDGQHLLFTSREQLGDYDNASPGCFGGACAEVYLFDAGAGGFACVSCSPTGDPPAGDARLLDVANTLGAAPLNTHPPARNLLADGSGAFFETRDSLVAGDSNGKIDVYGWKDGQLELISGGTGGSDSHFADASASGDNVFFTTRDRLVRSDEDTLSDLYDARVGGRPEPPPPSPPCAGDDCQVPPSDSPRLQAPVNAGPESGNFTPGRRPSFSLRAPSKALRARLASGRSIQLRVRVSQAGRLALTARATFGRSTQTVARATARARKRGTARLPLKLSRRARGQLQRTHRLRLSLSVRFGPAGETKRLVLSLQQGRGR
jgi:hypothetical protein